MNRKNRKKYLSGKLAETSHRFADQKINELPCIHRNPDGVCGKHRWAHLEAGLQINVLHWLPAAIKPMASPDGYGRCIHVAYAASWPHNEKLFAWKARVSGIMEVQRRELFHRVGGFIDHHRARNQGRLEGGSRSQHRLLIMYGDDYTIEQKDCRESNAFIKKKIDRQPRHVIPPPKLISPLPFTWWNHNPYTPRGWLEISH